jgi:hypothetical protein
MPVEQPESSRDLPASSSGYVYKMVQIPPVIELGEGSSVGQEAASYLQRVVNAHAGQGWEFYRVDSIGVRVPPGCLGVFLGERETVTTTEYYVITFRRPGNPSVETVPDPVATVKDAAREREQLRAKEAADREARARQEAADREAKAKIAALMRAAARRAKRDEAYRAMGIEPGPMAWFRALPDAVQALLIGAAIIVPVGIVFWLVIY